jgi:hypothetical protein
MSNVKIKANASGTADFTIEAPATDSALTLTLPSVAGELLTTTGDGSQLTNLPSGGKVLQVVSTTKTDTFSTTSTSFTDITGLSASITPSATSSKILILVEAGVSHGDASRYMTFNIVRGSTNISQPSTLSGIGYGTRTVYHSAADEMLTLSIHYLDSPSTTSATTYKVQCYTNGGTMSVNQRDLGDFKTTSTITLMEIGA